jgi:hypothetical protein
MTLTELVEELFMAACERQFKRTSSKPTKGLLAGAWRAIRDGKQMRELTQGSNGN